MKLFHRHSYSFRGCMNIEHVYRFTGGRIEIFPYTVNWTQQARDDMQSLTIRSCVLEECNSCGKIRYRWYDGDWRNIEVRDAGTGEE